MADTWLLDIVCESLEEFYSALERHCFSLNRPALFRNAGSLQSADGPFFDVEKIQSALSVESLSSEFGSDKEVPVVVENKTHDKDFSRHHQQFESVRGKACTLDVFLNQGTRPPDQYFYLKDWHYLLEKSRVEGREKWEGVGKNGLFSYPEPLQEDWLNEYCLRKIDSASQPPLYGLRDNDVFSKHMRVDGDTTGDYRFVYIGDIGSTTPPHMDVFGSYSWSFNAQGRKRWRFFKDPPSENHESGDYFDIIQDPGDLVFVPSGVYHSVENIGELDSQRPFVISVNQNWFNRYNVSQYVTPLLCREAMSAHNCVDEETRAIFRNSQESCERKSKFVSLNVRLSQFLTAECQTVVAHDEIFSLSPTAEKLNLTGASACVRELVATDGWFSQVELILQSSGSWNLTSFRRLLCFIADERKRSLTSDRQRNSFRNPASDLIESLKAIKLIDQTIESILN